MTREAETVEKIARAAEEARRLNRESRAAVALSVIRKIVFEEVEKGIADAQASALSDFTAGKWDALMKLKAALIERLGSGKP